jgi:hypothetical protein
LSQARTLVAAAAYVLYAIVCVSGLFVLSHQVSLANRFIQGDTSVTVDQAGAADNDVSTMKFLLLAVFVVLLVAAILWERNVAKALGKQAARRILNRSGLGIVWAVWIVLLVVGSALQYGTTNDLPSLVSADHRSMVLLGARALMVLVIAVLTPIAYRRAKAELASRPVPATESTEPLDY